MVGNYTDGDEFVRSLAPFWFQLFASRKCAGEYGRVMVFVQGEHDEGATAYEIFRENPDDDASMSVKKHKCPFSWHDTYSISG